MARSILPSRWRGAAKSRAIIHRALRRQVSQSLRQLSVHPECWDEGVDLGEEAALGIAPFVSQRRGQDKLNHFERWAVQHTRDLPQHERLGHLRALMPGGVIGQHAMTHLRRHPSLMVDDGLRRIWSAARKLLMDRGELAEVLRSLIEVGDGVRCLHLAMKTAARIDSSRTQLHAGSRRLGGTHDVLPFLDWLERDRTSRYVVDSFCRAFKETGDVEVALARTVVRQTLPVFDVEWIRL